MLMASTHRHLSLAALTAGLALAVVVAASERAHAQQAAAPSEDAVQIPIRLTAGSSHQWMGTLSPDGQALYFVSDRNSTAEIFVQKPVDSGPKPLFDQNADAAWPSPSPDGKRLAYLSYQSDSTGDLCIFDLADKKNRCVSDDQSAELQPMWLDGSSRVGALTRTALHADYELRSYVPSQAAPARVDANRIRPGSVVLKRNMLGVAASPDGRWLAYVPLARPLDKVGISFVNQSEGGLQLQRMDNKRTPADSEPIRFVPDLPGITEFPAFSRDSQYLYFAQYLNDTNADGQIDGNDHSVLFRVKLSDDAKAPIGPQMPEQLTSARWNCRYPAPATDRLIITCAHEGSLDIYALPLGGAVPQSWDKSRLRGEIHVARNHWAKLLLYGRLAAQTDKPDERVAILRHMLQLHIELREYESALYYSEQVSGLTKGKDPVALSWAQIMRELAAHRRADVLLTHGQLSDRYVKGERERATRLETTLAGADDNTRALAQLVLSEIQSDLGHKAKAEDIFTAIELDPLTDPLVLDAYAWRARDFYNLRGQRQELLSVYQRLAGHPVLDTIDRLRFAEMFVAELVRGVPHKRRDALLAGWVEKLEPDSELSLTIQVAGWLQQLKRDNQEEVRKGIFELYKQNKDPDRRRALVLATVRTAAREGNEYLQYQFATSWASWLKRSEPERKYAESLYRQVVLERAYTELSANEIAKARATFYAATVQTTSLEAHIGFIEASIREGNKELEKAYADRFSKTPDSPEYAFVRAYLIARELASIEDRERLSRETDRAVAYLRKAAQVWPRSLEIEHVWGTVLHQRALRTASKDDAVGAQKHYALALDLARDNVRFRAAVLRQLGLLQASLGNHRIALEHFTARDRLPYVRPEGELNVRMAMARSYYQSNQSPAAVEQAEAAMVLVDANVELARYRPLVQDRLALYLNTAGAHAKARERYDDLVPVVDGAKGEQLNAPINRLKARLGGAAAALGEKRYQDALARLDQVDALLEDEDSLRTGLPGPKPSFNAAEQARFDARDYHILVAGLRAQAHRGLERYDDARTAMQRRYDLIAKRFDDVDIDEDLLDLAHAQYHLADYAYQQNQRDQARVHLERGIGHSDEFNERTGSGVNEVGLRLLQSYAELHLYGKVPLASYQRDLTGALRAAYTFICKYPNPDWEDERFLFSLYLTMLEVAAS